MKKYILITLIVVLMASNGCANDNKRDLFLPEVKNDKTYTTIGGGEQPHQGGGYTLSVPAKGYRYEKDFDDVKLEEKWNYTKKDDVEIKVITYKNSDEITARSKFLRDNNDYIFEDLTGYSLCGTEPDGDTLWFNLHESEGTVYIVSWEYPKNTSEKIKTELSDIAKTFTITK